MKIFKLAWIPIFLLITVLSFSSGLTLGILLLSLHTFSFPPLRDAINGSVVVVFLDLLIAICAKVWNRVNLSIFAFSETGTCSASIAIASLSIILIFVVLESPNWYLSHNVVYMPGNLIIKCICERPSFETASPGVILRSKFPCSRSYINVMCYFKVPRVEIIAEIHSVFPENWETVHLIRPKLVQAVSQQPALQFQ